MRFHVREKCDMGFYAAEPTAVYQEFKTLAEADVETMWLLGLTVRNKVKIKEMVAMGSLDNCVVYPRVICKRLLMTDCSSAVLVHNHPTGNVDPSNDDIRLTAVVKDAFKVLDLKLLDHVIIGTSYFSFRERNLL